MLLRDPSFSVAEPSDENEICIEDLFHPLIPNAVKNSIKFTCQKNICLLTGANMSGKSTFMKSIGLSIYLAQLGFPVPAKYMRFKLMDGIITSINLTDDLNLGYSHFYSEIKRIKTVAENLNKKQRLLVVFDELFRGTNLQDASEGSIEIINALSTIDKESFFVFSSHIYEIVNSLEKNNNIFFKYFKTQKNGDQFIRDYKLYDGSSMERFGMKLIKQERIIELIKAM